ncbi:MAG TPA: substrate-binding domain-containing protein [Pseudonocardiaceae bacterium]|nr:substrate-binding domain-containing protein [Pseudonocardiaceae bacterium]
MRKLVVGVAAAALLIAGCGSNTPASSSPPTTPSAASITASGKVQILYAGSLANLMEHDIGPAFANTSGAKYEGTGAGSTALVTQIKGKVKQGDVFISASTDANTGLMGSANGGWENWYATFATAPLEIGYNPNSKFVADLKSKPWQQVITESGFRMGSTDPKLDPKGKLAAQALTTEGLPSSAVQVFPEEQMVGRLQAGQLDAGFFYSSEAADLNIPTINLGSIKLKATYTVTVLNNAPNAAGGIAFVRYLFSDPGLNYMRKHGLLLQPVTVTGVKTDVPSALDSALGIK